MSKDSIVNGTRNSHESNISKWRNTWDLTISESDIIYEKSILWKEVYFNFPICKILTCKQAKDNDIPKQNNPLHNTQDSPLYHFFIK